MSTKLYGAHGPVYWIVRVSPYSSMSSSTASSNAARSSRSTRYDRFSDQSVAEQPVFGLAHAYRSEPFLDGRDDRVTVDRRALVGEDLEPQLDPPLDVVQRLSERPPATAEHALQRACVLEHHPELHRDHRSAAVAVQQFLEHVVVRPEVLVAPVGLHPFAVAHDCREAAVLDRVDVARTVDAVDLERDVRVVGDAVRVEVCSGHGVTAGFVRSGTRTPVVKRWVPALEGSSGTRNECRHSQPEQP
jgi:hypothetical protein